MPARVLWLVKGLARGGAERLLALTAAKLDRRRFEVEVAYLLPSPGGFGEELAARGVATTCLGARRTVEAGWPLRLRRLLRERRYDLVHTHSPLPGSVARVLVRRGTRLVHTEHNVWHSYRRPTYLANALTYGRNDAVIAVSEGVAASIDLPWLVRSSSTPPVETLLHGVDLDRVARGPQARAAARRRLGLAAEAPVVGSVANLSAKKNHAGLLAAIDLVRNHIEGVRLLLIGSGPLEAELRRTVVEQGLNEHVRFLGSRDDVLDLLPALDVFVLASHFEGLPISLLEAMAAEVACVATRVGGIPEAVADGVHGRLVPPADPSLLAGAIVDLLTRPQDRRRLAAAGRQRVEEAFSIDRAVRRTEALYDEILRRPGTSPTSAVKGTS